MARKIEVQLFNGWTNYDTWLVALWLDNDYNNYQRIINKTKGLGTDLPYKDMLYTDKVLFVKSLHFGDKIKWHNVDFHQIIEKLNEIANNID